MYDVSLETVLSYVMCSGTRLNCEAELLIHNHNSLSLEVGHAIRDFLSPLKDVRVRHLLFTYGNLVTYPGVELGIFFPSRLLGTNMPHLGVVKYDSIVSKHGCWHKGESAF